MPARSQARIMIVDEHSTMRRIITNFLKQSGYLNLIEAEDGTRALSVLHKEKIDFVITEWTLPNLSGLDLLKAIRADPERKNIPVLMMTSEATPAKIKAAAEAGVSSYIIKPFATDTLAKKIAGILR